MVEIRAIPDGFAFPGAERRVRSRTPPGCTKMHDVLVDIVDAELVAGVLVDIVYAEVVAGVLVHILDAQLVAGVLVDVVDAEDVAGVLVDITVLLVKMPVPLLVLVLVHELVAGVWAGQDLA